jgi:hypothetical protein
MTDCAAAGENTQQANASIQILGAAARGSDINLLRLRVIVEQWKRANIIPMISILTWEQDKTSKCLAIFNFMGFLIPPVLGLAWLAL